MANKSAAEMEQMLTLKIAPALNRTARVFGYPVSEFLLLGVLCLVGMHLHTLLGPTLFMMMMIVGRVRKKKPVNWLQFMPYLWLKLKYAYLLPPGKKTFLP